MNFEESMEYIENSGKFGIKLGLKRIERLCELLGNPEKDLKIIHVAGTNGKGSTVTFISSILRSCGYKVGIYTSPYLERFTDRIKINDDEISQEDFAALVTRIKPLADKMTEEGLDHLTEFEIITACALEYYKEKKVDFAVLEVGLGGRFDATNVVNPILSVITTINYDHMEILGDTLSKIAYEKAGIIKPGKPVVLYPQVNEALFVLLDIASNRKSKVYPVSSMKYTIKSDTTDGITFDCTGFNKYENLKIKLLGGHQVLNAMTAIKSIEVMQSLGYKISSDAIYSGLYNAVWPGRFEILNTDPYIVLDGGHNIQGVGSLVKSVKKYFKGKKINIVCGMLKDKKYNEMVDELLTISSNFITVRPDSPRALSAEDLKSIFEKHDNGSEVAVKDAPTIKDAVEMGLKLNGKDEVLVFCGSLYMIGLARTELRNILKIK